MSKHKPDPLIEALKQGRSFTWTIPEGGDLASMRAALKHGQTLTMSPITDPAEIQVGDKVLVRWHGGTIFHLVSEIQSERSSLGDGTSLRFLIVNSLGKVNGWVGAGDILGRVTQVIEPEARPTVPDLLDQLDAAFCRRIERQQPVEDDARRLLAIVDDLRWYAARLAPQRWTVMPRSNKWSFEQNLYWLVKKAQDESLPDPVRYLTDRGKYCVGLAGEICVLFDGEDIY